MIDRYLSRAWPLRFGLRLVAARVATAANRRLAVSSVAPIRPVLTLPRSLRDSVLAVQDITEISINHLRRVSPRAPETAASCMGSPSGSRSARPGNSGDVRQARGACTTSSPMKRTEKARRRRSPPTPPAACSASMWKNTPSPGSSSQPTIGKASRSASMSGRSSQAALREPACLAVHERARHQPRPQVRSGDELERRFPADGVDRHPQRAGLRAGDVVVRLVLVPGRALPSARLLHQHVVVVQANLSCAHQLPGDGGGLRAPDELLVLGYPLPVAEVLDEAAGVVVAAGNERPLAGLGQVAFDAALDQRHLVGREGAAHSDGAVAAEVLDQIRGQHRPSLRSQRGSTQNRPCRRFRHSRPVRRPSSSITARRSLPSCSRRSMAWPMLACGEMVGGRSPA